MILWPPAAPFSNASTWPRAASRTSTHEFDSERSSLVFGELSTTFSYHLSNEAFKDDGDAIGWMAGWIFNAYQSVLFCLDETTAHPEHLLFDTICKVGDDVFCEM